MFAFRRICRALVPLRFATMPLLVVKGYVSVLPTLTSAVSHRCLAAGSGSKCVVSPSVLQARGKCLGEYHRQRVLHLDLPSQHGV